MRATAVRVSLREPPSGGSGVNGGPVPPRFSKEKVLQRSLGIVAGAALAVVLFAGCGHGTLVTSGPGPTPTPFPPHVASEYLVPTAAAKPFWAVSAFSSIWFTETAAGKIGQLTASAAPL